MQKWERALHQMALGSGAFFAWLLAVETGLLLADPPGDGVLFRWQIWLLATLGLMGTRDFVSQIRCVTCGSRAQISPLRLLPLRELLCRCCLNLDQEVVSAVAPVLSTDSTAFAAMPDALKPYWMRRPNKAWLPAWWVSTTRTHLRRWAGLSEEKPA